MFTLVHCLFTCRTTDLCLIFHIYPPFRKKVMEHRVTDKYFTTMDAALSDKGTFIAPQLHPSPSTIMVQYVGYFGLVYPFLHVLLSTSVQHIFY
jgi:hypothetical protein